MSEASWYYARGDQQRGPVPQSALRQLVTSGEVSPTDLVWREGMAQWSPVGNVAEFSGIGVASAGRAVAPTPPPILSPSTGAYPPGGVPQAAYSPPPVGYYAPPATAPALGDDAGMRWLLPVGRSAWAIAAGYLGLFSFVILPAPLALLISIIAIVDLKKHPQKHGWGRAIFGLVTGILGTIVLCYVFAVKR